MKVFGAANLRSVQFMLPIAESDKFLDELEKIAPYSMQDVVSAVTAGTQPDTCRLSGDLICTVRTTNNLMCSLVVARNLNIIEACW